MTLQYCSDLHLEFPDNKKRLNKYPLQANGDILVLAGDIVPFVEMNEHNDFFDFISGNFKLTYWIPGNHEYYYSDATERSGSFCERIRENVLLVNNLSFRHDGVKLIFSTLWSKISAAGEWEIERRLSDFQVIKFNGHFFSVADFNQLHAESLDFVMKELSTDDSDQTIVISHHAPTFVNYPPRFKGSILNEAFAVELFPLPGSSKVDYWIYGHHHSNIPDFNIDQTILTTNQLGYVKYNENRGFNLGKSITL